ncbi:MAG: nucleotide exchange factor GrpE [Nocardioides sp.]
MGFGEAAGEAADETEVEFSDDLSQAQTDVARAHADVAALTHDLQRLQAEYLNYKRRVDRDRDLVRENATYAALAPITEVLDTIDRAREHGPLGDGFAAVADQLERVVAAQGLAKFGTPGDAFDPLLHEALSHLGEDPDVPVTTCRVIAKAGYRIGDRVVRAAQVLVVDPVSTPVAEAPAAEEASAEASAAEPGAAEGADAPVGEA